MLQELQESKAEADRLRRANEASEERLASLSSSAKCSHWQRLVQTLCAVKERCCGVCGCFLQRNGRIPSVGGDGVLRLQRLSLPFAESSARSGCMFCFWWAGVPEISVVSSPLGLTVYAPPIRLSQPSHLVCLSCPAGPLHVISLRIFSSLCMTPRDSLCSVGGPDMS